jgi:glycosyltransferase involved in cell wall biosynthesis
MGNIESAVERVPVMGSGTELVFVDGESSDGTVEKIEEMIRKYQGVKDIRLIHQTAPVSAAGSSGDKLLTPPDKMLKLGKGDAVRKGFDAASGDILMILDSDLTVPPEDLPKFYDAIASGKGEFINGTRLVYQMEKQAMRTLNLLGNKFFSKVFTWLLEQPIKDTLCGTKVLFKRDYENIKVNRNFFGDFDPFGDFDLLFGAAKQNLKIVEVPIRYRMRTYGDIKIERFKHGLILLKMSLIGFKKLKLFS